MIKSTLVLTSKDIDECNLCSSRSNRIKRLTISIVDSAIKRMMNSSNKLVNKAKGTSKIKKISNSQSTKSNKKSVYTQKKKKLSKNDQTTHSNNDHLSSNHNPDPTLLKDTVGNLILSKNSNEIVDALTFMKVKLSRFISDIANKIKYS